jgi:peptidoglycan/xylan/chitin deacetylase (PgdA/CDA1 family)
VRDSAINLTFHGIGSHDRALDAGEGDVWVSEASFLSVIDAAAGHADVRITFDDGNASDLHHGLPALRERGLTATFFVVAGRLGEPGFLDADDVRTLAAEGMTIGCHGMRHRPWRGLDTRALQEELVTAKGVLEDVVGQPVIEAACPFGSYDRRVLAALRRSGYRHVYTSDRGHARPTAWLQARNTVRRGDGAELMAQVVSPLAAPARLRRHARLTAKRWR